MCEWQSYCCLDGDQAAPFLSLSFPRAHRPPKRSHLENSILCSPLPSLTPASVGTLVSRCGMML